MSIRDQCHIYIWLGTANTFDTLLRSGSKTVVSVPGDTPFSLQHVGVSVFAHVIIIHFCQRSVSRVWKTSTCCNQT